MKGSQVSKKVRAVYPQYQSFFGVSGVVVGVPLLGLGATAAVVTTLPFCEGGGAGKGPTFFALVSFPPAAEWSLPPLLPPLIFTPPGGLREKGG